MSPHFFGLPVDFLLGHIQDPVSGEVSEWIQEHQTRLRIAFEGAQERLRVAAERRNLVLLWDFSAKACHKIQDLWGSVVYRVLKAPKDRGSVYTIAPTSDLSKVKHVHRTRLKAVVGAGTPDHGVAPFSPPLNQQQSEDESPPDGDLFVLRQEVPNTTPIRAAAVTLATPRLLLPQVDLVPNLPGPSVESPAVAGAPSVLRVDPPALYPGEVAVRHSVRSTAGHHSNVHHLPRSAGDVVRGAANSDPVSSSALFRPWN